MAEQEQKPQKPQKAPKDQAAPKEPKEPKAPKKGGGKPKGEAAPPVPEEPAPVPTLKLHYDREVVAALKQRFGYKNPHQVPRLVKIVLNMGAGDALTNPKFLEAATADLTAIGGQKPSVRRARKSIANFKLREGVAIGTMVTLRGPRMYEFMERLISVAIPRIRDFRGLSPKGFDGRGNFSFGVKEQIIFPEIKYDKVEKIRGMDVTFVTSANTDEEGYELLKALRMPFRER